mgnify:CR=1 FL=1
MAKKFSLDDFVMPSAAAKGREQIEYIDILKLHEDANNFYHVDGVEELARNIATVGLQQPLRIRKAEDGYTIVSGHRRFAALALLAEEDPEKYREVPCIVEADGESAHLTELRLIFANMDTRKMTSADISKQAERVQELLYELKEEGYEFPGRMRDWVAEAVGVSKSKLSRLKVIRDNLTPELLKEWEAGTLNESAAYAYAQMPEEDQPIVRCALGEKAYEHTISRAAEDVAKMRAIKCGARFHTKEECTHITGKLGTLYSAGYRGWTLCANVCCKSCGELAKCKRSCELCAKEKEAAKNKRKETKAEEKAAQDERDRPAIEMLTTLWQRFGEARKAAGLTLTEAQDAAHGYHVTYAQDKSEQLERGEKINGGSMTPYGYSIRWEDARTLVNAADAMHTSVDFLLGRDVEATPAPVPASGTAPQWRSCLQDPPAEQDWVFVVEDCEWGASPRGIARYTNGKYLLDGDEGFSITLGLEHVWYPCAPTGKLAQRIEEEEE